MARDEELEHLTSTRSILKQRTAELSLLEDTDSVHSNRTPKSAKRASPRIPLIEDSSSSFSEMKLYKSVSGMSVPLGGLPLLEVSDFKHVSGIMATPRVSAGLSVGPTSGRLSKKVSFHGNVKDTNKRPVRRTRSAKSAAKPKNKPSDLTAAELLSEMLRRTTRPIFTTRVIIVHVVHMLIAAYFLTNCESEATENASFAWHDMVCGNTEVGWGTGVVSFPSLDRFLHLDLGVFFILANVVPKYIKRDLAKRHQHNVVKRLRINPLLVHVIAGILTVIISGVVSWTECYNKFTMTLVVIADLAHQFSIYRLLKNHDGIWQLRVGNLALGVAKWICVLRIVVLGDFAGPTNVIFIHSMGFGLTRLFCTICAVVFSFVSDDLVTRENWYSIGLSGAQFYCGYRNQVTYVPAFWISCIMSAVFYYGKNLDRKYQKDLILSSIIMCLVSKFMISDALQIPAIIAFYACGYWAPILHRTRDDEMIHTPKTPAINWKKGFVRSVAHIAMS